MAAGAVAHDHRDLRDDAGRVHVAAEDLAVEAERDDALLDPGAGALVDADDRAAGLHGEVHDLGDLLAVDLAEGAAEDREVLGEDADLAAVDGAVAGDHAVAVGPVFSRPKAVDRCRASSSSSTKEPSSKSISIRSRAVLRPLACCFSTALAEPACTASSRRRSRSASLPAVVWMSMSSGTSVPSPGCALTRERLVRCDLGRRRTPTSRCRPAGRGRSGPAPGLTVEVVDEAGSTNALVAERGPRRAPDGAGRRGRAPDRGPGPAGPDAGRAAGALGADVLGAAAADRAARPRGRGCRCWPGTPWPRRCAAAGFEASVKWPNDVLLADRKVAGILVERIETGGRSGGGGRDRAQRRDDRRRAAGARGHLAGRRLDGAAPDRTDLLVALLRDALGGLHRRGRRAATSAGTGSPTSYVAACATVGRQVRVDLPSGEVLTGTATRHRPERRLLVERDGVRTAVNAGDVVHVRDA